MKRRKKLNGWLLFNDIWANFHLTRGEHANYYTTDVVYLILTNKQSNAIWIREQIPVFKVLASSTSIWLPVTVVTHALEWLYMLSQLSWTYTSKESTKHIKRTSNEIYIVLSSSYKNCFTLLENLKVIISIQTKLLFVFFFNYFFIEIC